MRNKKIILLALVLLPISRVTIKAFGFVDVVAYYQRAKYWKDTLKEWKDKFYYMEKKSKWLNIHNASVRTTMMGLLDDEMKGMVLDIDYLTTLLNSPLFRDRGHLDPWRDLFYRFELVKSHFFYFDKSSFIKKNKFYKKNKTHREKINESLESEKKEKKSLRSINERIKVIKKFIDKSMENLKDFDTFLKDATRIRSGIDNQIRETKLSAIRGMMIRDLIQCYIYRMAINRTLHELETAEELYDINYTKGEHIYSSENK